MAIVEFDEVIIDEINLLLKFIVASVLGMTPKHAYAVDL